MKTKLSIIMIVCLCLAFSSGCTDSSPDTYTEPIADTSTEVYTESTESDNICYFDFKFKTTSKIGDEYEADSGFHYMIVTLYLKNAAVDQVTTLPFCWEYVSDGISYPADIATYDESIDHSTVNVAPGQEAESVLVFMVPTSSTEGQLSYNGFLAPTLEEIQYY